MEYIVLDESKTPVVPLDPQREPKDGDLVWKITATHKLEKRYYDAVFIPTEEGERNWRNSELRRTDLLMLLTDYPNQSELIAYRKKLREYPESRDFPSAARPTE